MNAASQGACPICRCPSTVRVDPRTDLIIVDCARCGRFGIAAADVQSLFLAGGNLSDIDRAKLSAYTREATLRNDAREVAARQPVLFNDRDAAAATVPPYHGFAVGASEALSSYPESVSDRLDRGLLNLARMSGSPGAWVPVSIDDGPALFAPNVQSMGFMLWQLAERGHILKSPPITYNDHGLSFNKAQTDLPKEIILTAKGWERVAVLQVGRIAEKPDQAFVAMWFGRVVASAYKDGIEQGVLAAGYKPLRIDNKQHNNMIDDEIIAEIRKSRFVVADFTGHRRGVYFEAGFALGLGIPVIWTVRKNNISRSHFDTRQYNHITWESPDDLKQQLHLRIEATIGRGNHVPSSD